MIDAPSGISGRAFCTVNSQSFDVRVEGSVHGRAPTGSSVANVKHDTDGAPRWRERGLCASGAPSEMSAVKLASADLALSPRGTLLSRLPGRLLSGSRLLKSFFTAC